MRRPWETSARILIMLISRYVGISGLMPGKCYSNSLVNESKYLGISGLMSGKCYSNSLVNVSKYLAISGFMPGCY